MFNVNDTIIYGEYGVCTITGIITKNFGKEDISYYSLKPIANNNSVYYVPVNNENVTGKFKELLSKDEVLKIIDGFSDYETIWIDNEKQRKEDYKTIVSTGNRIELAKLIKTLHLHQAKQVERGKKVHLSDDKYLKEAEQILFQELSYVLDVNYSEVANKIYNNI